MSTAPLVYPVYASQPVATNPARLKAQLKLWLPILVCLLAFAVESTSYFGSNHTSAPLRTVAESIFGVDIDPQWETIHFYIRKTGHFVGYGIFALACFRGFWMCFYRGVTRLRRSIQAHGLAILATFLVASADEIHQSFLPNRYGQFSDVLLDTCGGAALCFALFLLMQAIDLVRTLRTGSVKAPAPAYVE